MLLYFILYVYIYIYILASRVVIHCMCVVFYCIDDVIAPVGKIDIR